ncbi:MAG TPA: holo-ACP synthase [Chitinophagaceae bacterium]|nr:holo-ACP synthase [Chitinophagaceae bacterium]HNF71608.1 holo-ACP synthase [Chitinophagaceae bacterium]
MITGTGTDIIEVQRIAEKLSRSSGFREHVFSASEISYCEKQKHPAMHYAARWAAKEAYLKARGVEFIGNHRLPEIEVLHHDHGKPYLHLSGASAEDIEQLTGTRIHLSLSHTMQYAIALVIIETL